MVVLDIGFFIWVPRLVYSDSLVLFIISLILLLGFFIWVLRFMYFCLDFVASLEGICNT